MKCVPLSELQASLEGPFDVAVFSGSYDDRCLSCAKATSPQMFRNVIAAWNANHADYNRTNYEKLLSLFSGSKLFKCELNSDDPLETADAFQGALMSVGIEQAKDVLVDVTAFTREALAILLVVLRNLVSPDCKVVIVYNAAERYSVGSNRLWLSAGIREVRSILGYSGALIPSKPSHLIVLPGYEHERAAELIASYEPMRLSIGQISRVQSISDSFYELHQDFINSLAAVYEKSRVSFFSFSAKDVMGTKAAILQQAHGVEGFNPVVACLNSKLAMVGACLACFEDEDIQLCYAQPERYNIREFSYASSKAYLEEISLY